MGGNCRWERGGQCIDLLCLLQRLFSKRTEMQFPPFYGVFEHLLLAALRVSERLYKQLKTPKALKSLVANVKSFRSAGKGSTDLFEIMLHRHRI